MRTHKIYLLPEVNIKQVKIRLPEEYLIRLKEIAYENRRSFNNEILFRLAETLSRDENVVNFKQGENNENI